MIRETSLSPGIASRVLAALPTPVLACGDDGTIVFANAALASMIRRDEASLVGAHVAELVPERQRCVAGAPLHVELADRAARSGQTPLRLALLRDQLEIDVACTASAVDGLLVLSLSEVRDETEARTRPGSYQLIFEHAPLGILHFDSHGVITECNETFVSIIGSSRRVLVGLNMLTLPDATMVRCVRAALAGQISGSEGDYRSATAGKVTPVSVLFAPIHEDGRITGGVGIVRDDSERKAAMEALRQSEASFRALIEGTPDGIAVVHDDRLVYANPTLARLLGHDDPDAIRGASIRDVVHADDLVHLPPAAAGVDAQAHAPPLVDLRWRRSGDGLLDTEAALVPVRFAGEAAVAVVARDVTEARALRARLSRADRLAAVGTLAAGVAHEINNPLAYLMASLETAQRALRRPSPPSVDHLLERALDGARRVRRIVADLRLFSRPDEPTLAPVDVVAVLESTENLCMGEIKHRARLVTEYGPVPAVLGEEVRLGQVFVNLLVNAAHAIPADRTDGRIAVRTSTTADGRARIEIEDNGSGIAPEILPHVFEPFVTSKPVGVGSGLGLSICHGLVTALGGEIALDSELGRGTTVRITLPAAGVPARERAADPTARAIAPGRILLVDDEQNLLQSLRLELGERHEVSIATSGREALDLILGGGDFDLVLCDVMMAGVSGLDVYRALLRSRPDVLPRFAFMTGGVLSLETHQAVVATGRPRLDKPFAMSEVERLLIGHVARRLHSVPRGA